ncbi:MULTISPECIES: TonB family protein [Kordiimonas]|jgi:TonB family protein|uniref:TonB family protein n=1 Tax=Kordiimonas TaxID=288021 RepID=UPI00257E02FB|nr:TonB family protein [Kordiimonas sp. UBA4487]
MKRHLAAALLLSASLGITTPAFAGLSLEEHEARAQTMTVREAYAAYEEWVKKESRYYAEPYAHRVYSLLKEAAAQDERHAKNLAQASLNYGRLLLSVNKRDQAEEILEEALVLFQNQYGNDAPEVIDPLMDLGHAETKFLSGTTGGKYYRRAIEIAEKLEGEDSALVGQLYYEMAEQQLVMGAGKRNLAVGNLKKAYKIFQATLGENHGRTALASYRLGELKKLDKRYDAAAEFLEAAVRVYDSGAPNERLTQRMHTLLVETYEKMGESDLATKHCQAVGRIKEANRDPVETGESYEPLFLAQPKYPVSAQRRGLEGTVVLELTVTKDGRTSDFRVMERYGPDDFVKASIEAARKFRYSARHENGQPVDTAGVKYRFVYSLR